MPQQVIDVMGLVFGIVAVQRQQIEHPLARPFRVVVRLVQMNQANQLLGGERSGPARFFEAAQGIGPLGGQRRPHEEASAAIEKRLLFPSNIFIEKSQRLRVSIGGGAKGE